MPPKPLPEAALRLHTKRGKHDCAIASLASYLGRDYEEVLIAASKVSKTCWTAGLSGPEHIKVARRLGFRTSWHRTFDIENECGVLWVSYNDTTSEHSVVLIDGMIFDPEYTPPSLLDHDDYCRVMNAVPRSLLVKES